MPVAIDRSKGTRFVMNGKHFVTLPETHTRIGSHGRQKFGATSSTPVFCQVGNCAATFSVTSVLGSSVFGSATSGPSATVAPSFDGSAPRSTFPLLSAETFVACPRASIVYNAMLGVCSFGSAPTKFTVSCICSPCKTGDW